MRAVSSSAAVVLAALLGSGCMASSSTFTAISTRPVDLSYDGAAPAEGSDCVVVLLLLIPFGSVKPDEAVRDAIASRGNALVDVTASHSYGGLPIVGLSCFRVTGQVVTIRPRE